MMRILAPLALLGLAACADVKYYKPGATMGDFRVDSYACERDARSVAASFGSSFGGVATAKFYGRCMASKGWEAR